MILLNRGAQKEKTAERGCRGRVLAIARNARYYFRVLTRTREFRDRLFPWSVLSQERIMDANADASEYVDKAREKSNNAKN